jgi:uncharacterized membrane protein YdjX (TVP38/TMEM64 family)
MSEETMSLPDAPQSPDSDTAAPSKSSPWLRLALTVGALVVLFVVGREAGVLVPRFAEWVQGLGVLGPIVFILGYIVATVAFVPGSLLTLAAGAIFGIGAGVAYVFVGATVGATLAFLVSRYVARSAIEQKLQGNKRFEAIDRAVAGEGLKIVFLLRLSPVFPFNLLNYGLGLTQVRLRDYMLACFGMLPGSVLYVYYGKLAGDVAALAAGASTDRGAEYWTILIVGLVATLAVTTIVTRIACGALRNVTSD